eukprot:8367968-Pyramimonas_sp.AAC.1
MYTEAGGGDALRVAEFRPRAELGAWGSAARGALVRAAVALQLRSETSSCAPCGMFYCVSVGLPCRCKVVHALAWGCHADAGGGHVLAWVAMLMRGQLYVQLSR